MTETLARNAVPSQSTAATDAPSIGGRARIRVGIIGATGYAGGEMLRLLDLHPNVRVVGLQGRGREQEPVGTMHPHLARTGYHVDSSLPEADAVFMALPHGLAAAQARDLVAGGATIIDQGPDFRLRDPADYPRWYGFEHPAPDLLARSVYGLPELHRDELAALGGADVAIVGAPGCYPTATLLALAPLARAGLIADLVVDAKSGVSGAGREPKADLGFSEVNESVKAYGIGGHRHVAEMEQELALLSPSPDANPGVGTVDFLPHLIPMTRGILSAGHVRPTRPVTAAELRELYRDAYRGEPFVEVTDAAPATKHVTGSNHARVFVTVDERTGRILAIGVVDNLVKGAAGQAIQAFNVVFGLPETAGLEQRPLSP
jgi:N-acetyl-gamma-glutamyl-phosphate reductase